MTQTDHLGNPISESTAAAVAAYAEALAQFHCYRGDPVATIDAALAAEPGFVMGHVLHAWLHALGTEPDAIPVVLADVRSAEALRPNLRERAHLLALTHFALGRWQAAARVLEDLSAAWPHDALALQAGHLTDFYRGDSRMLRDRVARALPEWGAAQPGYHSLLAMHAFGCEEMGDYARAESQARRALELEPYDAWAQHAAAHVLEMTGRARDGVAWMRDREPYWAPENFLSVHNGWHLALFHLDLDEVDEVLRLFDGPIHGQRSKLVLDLVDASAMLWRLALLGIDVGDRWQTVAELWREAGRPGVYAFNDLHAALAWHGSGDRDCARQWRAAQTAVDESTFGDHAAIARTVGEPLLRALDEIAAGRYADAVDTLREVRPIAIRFGGSHAQRDLIDLTLIDAALRAHRLELARALINERMALKPASAINRRLAARLVS